jgi:hypothetical protein
MALFPASRTIAGTIETFHRLQIGFISIFFRPIGLKTEQHGIGKP